MRHTALSRHGDVPLCALLMDNDGDRLPFLSVAKNGQEQPLVSGYLAGSTPRSLHIFFAKISLISECLGIADRLFRAGLCHHECLPPSLKRLHPWP